MDTQQITFDQFEAVDMRIGTVLSVEDNVKAKIPAYILRIDFGEVGVKQSSAQLTRNYSKEELVGSQVVAVVNFPPKKIAGFSSEVLVLGALCGERGTVLLQPTQPVQNGSRIA